VPPRSFIVLEDSNDYAGCSRDTKFKPQIMAVVDFAERLVVDHDRLRSQAQVLPGRIGANAGDA
jgi:hypothetical protein